MARTFHHFFPRNDSSHVQKFSEIFLQHSIVNPYLRNGFSHHYHLGESTFIIRGVRSDFYFLSHFSMNEIPPSKQNSPRWDPAERTPHSAASHLGLCCLPMSHIRDARLKCLPLPDCQHALFSMLTKF